MLLHVRSANFRASQAVLLARAGSCVSSPKQEARAFAREGGVCLLLKPEEQVLGAHVPSTMVSWVATQLGDAAGPNSLTGMRRMLLFSLRRRQR